VSRSAEFLRFVVAATLAGRSNEVSQHAIAADVFGRVGDFDPTTDPIVRMQAGRVRRSLEHYYLTAGAADPVSIKIPKGTYVPTFAFREPSTEVAAPVAAPTAADTHSWPTLLVAPLRNLTGRTEADVIAEGLTFDLSAELSRYSALHVFLATGDQSAHTPEPATRFRVDGTVGLHAGDFRINLRLIDRANGRVMWARAYPCPSESTEAGRLREVIEETAATIAEENGVVMSRLLNEAGKRHGLNGDAYGAVLRHHYYESTRSPEAFVEALQALRTAVAKHPDCALCWSYLARLGAIHWSLGLPGDAIPVDEVLSAAQRGATLDPASVPVRLILAYVQILHDEVDPARVEIETALRMNGESIFWLDGIGYFLTLAGEFEQGPALIRQAVRVNPYHRPVCHAALWLDALRRHDPPAALAEARAYSPPAVFWYPLMEAVALVADDRVAEATAAVQRLLQLKPDFPERAHWFITRYVKFDNLVRRIESALETAGLQLPAHR
jgi:adenylate cyclase